MKARTEKRLFLNIITVSFLLLLITGSALAQVGNGAGTTSGDILNIGIGSRATSLGGAFTAFSDDATAPFWNPSGLSGAGSMEIQFGHSTWYQDISLNYLGAVIPVSERFSTGIGVAYVDFGEFMGYNEADEATGAFTGHNVVLSLSLAYRLSERFSVGVTAKGITEKLDDSHAQGFAFDLGTRYNTGIFSIGLAARNIGSGLKYEYDSSPLPTKFCAGLGISTYEGKLRFSSDIDIPQNGSLSLHEGAEYLYMNTIFLRSGYVHSFNDAVDNSSVNGLVYGFGLQVNSGSIDYSYVPNGDFGGIHRIDFSWKLGH